MTLDIAAIEDEQARRAILWQPKALHPALRNVERRNDGYAARFHDLFFIVSAAREDDGKVWLHASVSRRDRKLPTWDDLKVLKHYCIGHERKAIQVLPPTTRYVNLANVLHLFCCLSGNDGLPEFSFGGSL